VVGFLTMEPPTSMYAESLRDEQVRVFRTIPPIQPANVVRGQFEGYRQVRDVAPNSKVETFAALRLEVDCWRWDGVPFLLRTGKCMAVTATEVLVKLKQPPLRRFPNQNNYFRLRLGPDLSINLGAQIKRPGAEMVSMPVELSAVQLDLSAELMPYERFSSCVKMPSKPPGLSSIPSSDPIRRHSTFIRAEPGVRRKPIGWPLI